MIIVFMIGPYASGKTTYMKKKFKSGKWNLRDWVLVSIDNEVDNIAKEDNTSSNASYKEKLGLAIARCINKTKEAVESGKNIILDIPCNTVRARKTYLNITEGYEAHAVIFKVKNKEAWLERLEKRNDENRTISKESALNALKKIKNPSKKEGFKKIYYYSNI